MLSIPSKWVQVLVVMVAAAAIMLGLQAQPTEAGINGQQIRFVCPQMNEAIIRGTNQHGQRAEWRGSATQSMVTTLGWWWVGWVRVYYWNRAQNRWYEQPVNVPQRQFGDIYEARC